MYAVLSGLINGVILATVLSAAVWTALRLTPRRMLNAATRYVVWWITLVVTILIPITFLPFHHRGVARTIAPTAHYASPPPAVFPTYALATISLPRPAAIPIQVPASSPLPKWPILLWPAVTFCLLSRLATSLIALHRLKARARPVPASLFPRLAKWLSGCGGERHGIRLAVSAEIATPIAAGPRHPTILIPAHLFDDLTEEDLDRIGLHETAHLVRRDDYALIFQRIVEALFVPYPLVFWLARRIDLEREIACDDLVIAAMGRPRSYAACLTRIVESCAGLGSPWPAATAAESASQLSRRVEALLDKTRRAGAHLMKAPLAAVTTVLFCMVVLTGRAPALIAFVTTSVATHAAHLLLARRAPVLPMPAQAASVTSEDLTGHVMEDGTGKPIASAELRFHKSGLRELAADLETDRQGRFDAAGLPSGEYIIDVSKPNYITTSFRLATPASQVTVRLVRYGVIDGRAVNASGEPLPGVIRAPGGRTIGSGRITILTKDPASGRLTTFRDVTLEDGGRYRVYDLPPGRYAVGFWYSGQNEGSGMQLYPDNANPRFFEFAGGEEYDGVDFVVAPRPASQIGGTIQLPEGVKGQFQLALGLPEQPMLPIAQVLSEKDGSFRFEKIPPGSYDLFVAGPVGGYGMFDSLLRDGDALFGRTRVQTSGQNIEGLAIPVSPAKTLRVVVRAGGAAGLPEGCPLNVNLTPTPLEPWALLQFHPVEAAFGKEKAIENLAPGWFRIAASDLGNNCFQVNDPVVDLSAEQSAPAVIELASAGSVRGVVHGAAPGSVVVLRDAHAAADSEARVAYPDAAGHFTFEGLPPAHYRIAAFPTKTAHWNAAGGKEIEVAGGAPTDVEITEVEIVP